MNEIDELVNKYKIKLDKIESYCDEPYLEQYVSTLKINNNIESGTGVSFNNKTALYKSVYESIERSCLYLDNNQKKQFIYSSINKLNKDYLNPMDIKCFSNNQIDNNPNQLKILKNNKFLWINGKDLYKNKNVLIPIQLVFLVNNKKEKIIQQPMSTGAACGINLNDAILKGIFEVIERDAFMIHYLTKTCGELIDFSMNKRLIKIQKYFQKYNLELYLINLCTDLGIYTVLSLIIDRTGLGTPLSAGMKTGLDPYKCAISAIEEACMGISFSRNDLIKKMKNPKVNSNINSMHQRSLYWSDIKKLKYIDPWIKNKRKIKFNKMRNLSTKNIDKDLNFVTNILKLNKYDIYYVNIKKDLFSKFGNFEVIKVIIPSLQSLYLHESYKCLGNNRIYEVPVKLGYYNKPLREGQLNQIPHFFL